MCLRRAIPFRFEAIEIESSDVFLRNLFIIPEYRSLILDPHRIKFKAFIGAVSYTAFRNAHAAHSLRFFFACL